MFKSIWLGLIFVLMGACEHALADNLPVLINPNFIQPLKPLSQSKSYMHLREAQKRLKKDRKKLDYLSKKQGQLTNRVHFKHKKR